MNWNRVLKVIIAALVAGLSQSAMATASASNEYVFQTTVEDFARGVLLFTCIAIAVVWAYAVFLGITAKDSNIVHKPEEPETKIEEFSVVDETFGKTHIFYDLARKRINALDIADNMKHEMIKKLDMLASHEVLFSKEELIEQKNKVIGIIQNFELAKKQALKKSMIF